MPYPHVDSVIRSLEEPWFFGGRRSHAQNYGKWLTSKFEQRTDKTAVDNALGLGGYLVHSEANKNKRMALRAVMLAGMLMKETPVAQIDSLRKRCESLALDALKRAFQNQFPVIDDAGIRATWAPSVFTDPILLPELRELTDWTGKSVPKYKFIVHTNDDPITPSAVFADPVGELSKYAASSFSLMSHLVPFSYFPQGLIFKVPKNNILVTYHADVGSVLREQSIHKPTFNIHTFAEEITELSMSSGDGSLHSPQTILKNTGVKSGFALQTKSKYNELLICGMSGQKLPHGMTGKLQVTGVFIACTKKGKVFGFNQDAREKACKKHAKRLGVPLLYLPNEV